MKQQLNYYIENNNILLQTQSGFRKKLSCSTALTLTQIKDDMLRATDGGQIIILAIFEFTKAFDTLNHQTLLSVLHYVCLIEITLSTFLNSF